MASGIMRFAFVFFILGCVLAVGWTGKSEAGTRSADLAQQSLLPSMCSAWAAHLNPATTATADTEVFAASASSVVADSQAPVEAVWNRGDVAVTSDRSFRRSEGVKTSDR